MDQFRDLKEFHTRFKQLYEGSPRILDQTTASFRLWFLIEETTELKHALENHDLARALDALVDIDYVLKGTIVMMGLSPVFAEAWKRVHEANMKKELAGDASRSKRGNRYDIIKPEGWVAPNLDDLVA